MSTDPSAPLHSHCLLLCHKCETMIKICDIAISCESLLAFDITANELYRRWTHFSRVTHEATQLRYRQTAHPCMYPGRGRGDADLREINPHYYPMIGWPTIAPSISVKWRGASSIMTDIESIHQCSLTNTASAAAGTVAFGGTSQGILAYMYRELIHPGTSSPFEAAATRLPQKGKKCCRDENFWCKSELNMSTFYFQL